MKKIKFIALAFLALTLGSCMGDGYADPDLTEKVPASPWGNNSLREKNVISIADLKTQFASVVNSSTDAYKLIEKDMMIKAVVTMVIGDNSRSVPMNFFTTVRMLSYTT